MIMIDNIDVKIEDVYIPPSGDLVFIKRKKEKYYRLNNIIKNLCTNIRLTINIENDLTMTRLKHALIKRAIANKDPEDRVLKFEWWPDFEKRDRLIDARKTKDETDKEVDKLIENIEICEKNNIECRVFREVLQDKLSGTFGGMK